MKAIKWDGMVQSGMGSWFLQDEMDFEILIEALCNELDEDF